MSDNLNLNDKYKDDEKYDEHLKIIKQIPNIGKIIEYINTVFPTWLLGLYEGYCYNYPTFNNNLKKNITNKILLVDDMIFDDEHRLIRTFAEIFSKSGFLVRSKQEFIPCKSCKNKLVPTYYLYNALKIQKNISFPETWSDKCYKCL